MTTLARPLASVLALLALGSPLGARAELLELVAFESGSTAEVDQERSDRLFFKTSEGRLVRGVLLSGRLEAFASDKRLLAVNSKQGGRGRVTLFRPDGRTLFESDIKAGGASFSIHANAEQILLARAGETFVLDQHGNLLCHEAAAKPGILCREEPLAGALARGQAR